MDVPSRDPATAVGLPGLKRFIGDWLTQTSLPAPTAAEPQSTKMPEPFAHGYNRYLGFPTDTTGFNARIGWTMGRSSRLSATASD
jgi:hypothetical protein